jgi:hypothetical protein
MVGVKIIKLREIVALLEYSLEQEAWYTQSRGRKLFLDAETSASPNSGMPVVLAVRLGVFRVQIEGRQTSDTDH